MSSRWAESALSWWEDAGVDVVVGETPRDWLAPPKAVTAASAKAAEPAAPPPPTPPEEKLPGTLPAFQAWLAETEALPLAAPGARRIMPAGAATSGLMAITDVPSLEDVAAGVLFSGEQGALLDNMLRRMSERLLDGARLDRETLYLAPFSPIRPPAGRIDPQGVRFLAQAMRHHIALVAPKALLIFGDSCARALLDMPMARARGAWHVVATPGGDVPAIVTIRPQELLSQPNIRTHAWADLQMLAEKLKS
jgi:uracil-DNA glycosylase family 4